MSDEMSRFAQEVQDNIAGLAQDESFHRSSLQWLIESGKHKYSYNFRWLGIPIIQYPQDIIAVQELIWDCRPDLIVETGVAHGGSLILWASLLELLGGRGRVIGVDIDIRGHNRLAIEAHPMAKRISLIEGSSVAQATLTQVTNLAVGCQRPMVMLDSNHTHDHVLQELRHYAPLVRKGSYLVVFDTVIDEMPEAYFPNRPWGKNNNPRTAVEAFLRENKRFEVDKSIEDKLQITVCPGGYLRCVAE